MPIGVGHEYADGAWRTPPVNSRLTGARRTPTDAAIVRSAAKEAFFHAAKGSKTRLVRSACRVLFTFPMVRGILQEIFTAYLFAQRPHYLKRIDALRSLQLRI